MRRHRKTIKVYVPLHVVAPDRDFASEVHFVSSERTNRHLIMPDEAHWLCE